MLKFERSYLRNFHGKVEVEFLHSPTLSQSFYLALDFLPPSNFSISHFSLSENVGHLPQLILLPACLASPQIWVDIRPADRSFVLRVLLFEVLKSPLHLNSPSDPQNPFSLSRQFANLFFPILPEICIISPNFLTTFCWLHKVPAIFCHSRDFSTNLSDLNIFNFFLCKFMEDHLKSRNLSLKFRGFTMYSICI